MRQNKNPMRMLVPSQPLELSSNFCVNANVPIPKCETLNGSSS
jgi:hypothetical protein